jgi:hypothetical protein
VATVHDLTAGAAVAGGLKATVAEGKVFHDAFRPMPDGVVTRKAAALGDVRRKLIARKIELSAARDAAATSQAAAGKALTALFEQVAKGPDRTALEEQIERERAKVDEASDALSAATARLGMVESALSEIESFSKTLHAVPEGATRSPLAAAALREQLHHVASAQGSADANGADWRFTHVLLVRSQSGSVHQALEDKPLWFEDRYSVVAAVTVTYILLSLPDGDVVAAGHRNGTAAVNGSIGERFTVDVS